MNKGKGKKLLEIYKIILEKEKKKSFLRISTKRNRLTMYDICDSKKLSHRNITCDVLLCQQERNWPQLFKEKLYFFFGLKNLTR